MVTRSQKLRVIFLISVVSLIFMYIMFLLVGKKLMTKNDIYYIKLQKQSVAGLNVGTDVKFYGIKIGKVMDIAINPEDVSEIIVTISVKENTPIKDTAEANLAYQSIATGLKQIEITGGENEDANLNPGEYIKAGSDLFENISGKAEIIAQKIELLLNNLVNITSKDNKNKFFDLVESLERDSRKLDTLLTKTTDIIVTNKKDIKTAIRRASTMMSDVSDAAVSITKAVKSVDNKIDSKELASILNNLSEITQKINSKDLSDLIVSLNNMIKQSEETVLHVDKTFIQGRSNILRSLELMKETLENLNEFATMLKENPDILLRGKQDE